MMGEKLSIIAFPSHDWGHCIQYGASLRHAALLGCLAQDQEVENLLWVRRVHPKRIIKTIGRSPFFTRKRVRMAPLGFIYSITKYQWPLKRPYYLIEHSLPHSANKVLAAFIRWRIRSWKKTYSLWVGDPKETWTISELEAQRSVFDVMDDWREASEFIDDNDRIVEGYMSAREADVITINTPEVGELFYNHPDVRLMPNGYWSNDAKKTPPRWWPDVPRPWIAVIGRYSDDRLDFSLLSRTLDHMRDASLFVIGDFSAAPEALRMLKHSPNVFIMGPMYHVDVKAILSSLDLVLMPHILSPYTMSQDRITAYEAMSCGTPIVSTPVHPAIDFVDHCYIATRPDDWINSLRSALQENEKRRLARINAMKEQTWDHRYNSLKSALIIGGQ